MKKNRMMRLASTLLVAVLITTSTISGTYAKYVTTSKAEDTARVAKWGVDIAVSGKLFDETYKNASDNSFGGALGVDDATISVETSAAGQKLVAPGTKSDENGLGFTVSGVPEVDVRVMFQTVELEGEKAKANKDVFLKAGTYPDMTTADNLTDEFTLDKDYYPVKYTFTRNGEVLATGKNLAELKAAINAETKDYVSNVELSTTANYKITWEWAFGDQSEPGLIKISNNDKADTLLGNLMADAGLATSLGLTEGTDFNLYTGLKVAITAEQID